MQLNGIESGHSVDMHHVTRCMYDHAATAQKSGAASSMSSGGNVPPASVGQQEGQFSLSAWLEKTFGSGKRMFARFWDGNEGIATGERTLNSSQIAAAATAVTRQQTMQDSPYFSAVYGADTVQQTVWQRVRVKFRGIAGQLANHLPGNFFSGQARSSFQTKQGQERSKEDLRKRSKFRKDEVEIDCILTDDTYLLDTYDKKGEYSRLSASQQTTMKSGKY